MDCCGKGDRVSFLLLWRQLTFYSKIKFRAELLQRSGFIILTDITCTSFCQTKGLLRSQRAVRYEKKPGKVVLFLWSLMTYSGTRIAPLQSGSRILEPCRSEIRVAVLLSSKCHLIYIHACQSWNELVTNDLQAVPLPQKSQNIWLLGSYSCHKNYFWMCKLKQWSNFLPLSFIKDHSPIHYCHLPTLSLHLHPCALSWKGHQIRLLYFLTMTAVFNNHSVQVQRTVWILLLTDPKSTKYLNTHACGIWKESNSSFTTHIEVNGLNFSIM